MQRHGTQVIRPGSGCKKFNTELLQNKQAKKQISGFNGEYKQLNNS